MSGSELVTAIRNERLGTSKEGRGGDVECFI